MNLELVFINILFLLFGLYYFTEGIRRYKKKIVIHHWSEREQWSLFMSIYFFIETTFINNNNIELKWIVMGAMPILFFIIYVIYSRFNDVKYGIYNISQGNYEKIIKTTLAQNSIEFSLNEYDIEINETPAYIALIDKGILIKRCKCIPNYKKFLMDFETNLKEAKCEKKTKDWLINMLLGALAIIMSIFFLIKIFR